MLKFALAGNPNAGKTTLFNALTGSTARVGNWAGVTVEKREGEYKKLGETLSVVDLPGIYSLSPYSPEEKIARNFLINDTPDCIINVVDATNLERNLYLTTQLMELNLPVVVALNMMDELDKRGDSLDIRGLEQRLKIPIVEICALKGENVALLMEKALKVSKEPIKAQSVLRDCPFYPRLQGEADRLAKRGDKFPLFHAIKTMEGEGKEYEEGAEVIADARYRYITEKLSPLLKKSEKKRLEKAGVLERLDMVLTHKIWGIPIFFTLMLSIFYLTFGKISLGRLLSIGMDALTNVIGEELRQGLLALGCGAPLVGFLCDGLWGGISAVLGFLPQMLLLFLCFSALEDVGYMARVAFMLDKIFRPFGVSGRALLPMLMGFGCSVPAMISARTLASERERRTTVRVIPFFFCGAKMPVLLTLSGVLAQSYGVKSSALLTFDFYLLGIFVAFCSLLINQRLFTQKSPPFIMELPDYRMPSIKNLTALLWEKSKHFLEKAFTVIALSCAVVWGLSHFSFRFAFVGDRVENSMLSVIGKWIQPIFTPLGFGSGVKENGWVFAVATIAGLVAKEDIVAVLSALALCLTGGESLSALFLQTGITLPATLAFICYNLLTVPCLSALVTALGELGGKAFLRAFIFWFGISYGVAFVLYWTAQFLL